ncbi:MAG: class I SAM-dependent rRNA methyltransferase [Alphaproteobacteria bacterium]|nr:class I SAM-dependent rRNA methyltransferase [Alphaproteobacteria bacterium]
MSRSSAKRRRGGRPAAGPTADAVVVNGYSERWLRQGFPWVYPAEVISAPPRIRPGDDPLIRAESGAVLGRGLWDDGWIAVRRLREDDGPIDEALLAERVDAALALRQAVIDPETTAWRLLHGENDRLPGVRVDVYGHFLVLTLDSPSLYRLVGPLCALLQARLQPRGVFLAWRLDPRDDADRKLPQPEGLIAGHPPAGDVRVTERGVAALVRPGGGKDIGLYTDMRSNRAWLEPHWAGRRVLNLFAHTGFFSVVAALNGATEVVSVDLSEQVLERAEANLVANGLDPALHTFLAEDVRRALDRMRRTGELFDLVLLDPPGFSHGPDGPMAAAKDYPRLVAASLRVLAPDGWLVGALNVGAVSPRDFHNAVRDGARRAGRTLQLLHEGTQAPDHPAAIDFPEGRYLKFGVWRDVPLG